MIIVLKSGATKQEAKALSEKIEEKAKREKVEINVQTWYGKHSIVLGLLGDTAGFELGSIEAQKEVQSIKRVQEPYKKANRKFHPDDTVIDLGNGAVIGSKQIAVIAGPCSVESQEQIVDIAKRVKSAGAQFLRGGAYKPRTSPYSFQGHRAEGLEMLEQAKKETSLPIVTEIMSAKHIELFENVDIVQVGARNMQNFELLKELGKIDKPVLLKRGLANTLEELLMSAEYIMAEGNPNVILCERGIRTFETMTRNTLDISAVPLLKSVSHLPVVVDPSHASGISDLVAPLALSAIAAGADGLIIEVHNDPQNAMSDGAQSLTPQQFSKLTKKIKEIAPVFGKEFDIVER